MIAYKNKLDGPLKEIYSKYLLIEETGKKDPKTTHPAIKRSNIISLLLMYSENLTEIESKGFETTSKSGPHLARGNVHLENLENIASLGQVIRLEYGEEDDINLNLSVIDIKARENPPDTDFVWSVNSSGKFGGDSTGKNVVIGIIDSGIDYRHPVFLRTSDPQATRILRIWDQGLEPRSGESSPSASLLQSAFTYGVEYDNNAIDAGNVRHRDCNGHGTHVASIAAGDGRAPLPSQNNSEYRYIGVAPEADIIVVKVFSLEKNPKDNHNNNVSYKARFQDAVNYINNVVREEYEDRPVVINYSGGSTMGPHDGLTPDEQWLSNYYKGQTKKVFVTSAGNAGNKRQHAFLNLIANTPVEIPVELYDTRGGQTRDFKKCRYEDNTRSLSVECWYPDIDPGTLGFEVKLRNETSFRPATPLALDASDVEGTFDGNKEFKIEHESTSTIRPPSTNVIRNMARLTIKPAGSTHLTGQYILKLTSKVNVGVHVWCSQASRHGFKMGTSLPSEAVSSESDKSLLGPPGGADNIITVAAYNDATDTITSFSSRGPLADYTGTSPYLNKPDVGAPGIHIKAAKSGYTQWISPCCAPAFEPDYVEKRGTSMSSPHVAGVAALLLQHDPNLSTADIIQHILNEATPVSPVAPDELGRGRLNAHESFDAL